MLENRPGIALVLGRLKVEVALIEHIAAQFGPERDAKVMRGISSSQRLKYLRLSQHCSSFDYEE